MASQSKNLYHWYKDDSTSKATAELRQHATWKGISQLRVAQSAGSYVAPPTEYLTVLVSLGPAFDIQIRAGKSSCSGRFPNRAAFLFPPSSPVTYILTRDCQFLLLSIPAARVRELSRQLRINGARQMENICGRIIIDSLVSAIVQRLWRASASPDDTCDAILVDAAVNTLVTALLLDVESTQKASYPKLSSEQLGRVHAYVEAHLDRSISLGALAAEIAMEPFRFSRCFKASTGVAPYQWVLARRIQEAMSLLRSTDLPLVEVAYATGFSSQSHLTSTFSRMIQQTPLGYRRGKAPPFPQSSSGQW